MSASSGAGPGGQADLLVPSVPQPAPKVDGPGRTSPVWTWIGVLPFFIFALLFLILPTGFLMVGAFETRKAISRSPTCASCSRKA